MTRLGSRYFKFYASSEAILAWITKCRRCLISVLIKWEPNSEVWKPRKVHPPPLPPLLLGKMLVPGLSCCIPQPSWTSQSLGKSSLLECKGHCHPHTLLPASDWTHVVTWPSGMGGRQREGVRCPDSRHDHRETYTLGCDTNENVLLCLRHYTSLSLFIFFISSSSSHD